MIIRSISKCVYIFGGYLHILHTGTCTHFGLFIDMRRSQIYSIHQHLQLKQWIYDCIELYNIYFLN